ncbi:hypothetical protein PCASD_25899 [Puccinia coronata f. sp. avenae]|uniref:Uncharacterized protein n=1 Tax=Puccinia coronata f. sp. avenae TaxID=200324 RepID=A0A2N5S0A3_9BASI|nr:hypothetical protein PCASD_25899 [Puccinia coronata f. sp. avenae]
MKMLLNILLSIEFYLALPDFAFSAESAVLGDASKRSLQGVQRREQPILVKRLQHFHGIGSTTTFPLEGQVSRAAKKDEIVSKEESCKI